MTESKQLGGLTWRATHGTFRLRTARVTDAVPTIDVSTLGSCGVFTWTETQSTVRSLIRISA